MSSIEFTTSFQTIYSIKYQYGLISPDEYRYFGTHSLFLPYHYIYVFKVIPRSRVRIPPRSEWWFFTLPLWVKLGEISSSITCLTCYFCVGTHYVRWSGLWRIKIGRKWNCFVRQRTALSICNDLKRSFRLRKMTDNSRLQKMTDSIIYSIHTLIYDIHYNTMMNYSV